MIQVQNTIVMSEAGLRVEINVLAREDATPEEREIAHAIERMLLGLNQAVAEESGATLETAYIGEQHAADVEREALLAVARAAMAYHWRLISLGATRAELHALRDALAALPEDLHAAIAAQVRAERSQS